MIDIEHHHTQPDTSARAAAELVAQKLQQKFQAQTHWEGQTLFFKHSALDGRIDLVPGTVRVQARLGLLASLMQTALESKIRHILAEKLP